MSYLKLLFNVDNIREDFIGYSNITGDTTGENIAKAILDRLQEINLNPSDLRAQAYDGTGIYYTGNTENSILFAMLQKLI